MSINHRHLSPLVAVILISLQVLNASFSAEIDDSSSETRTIVNDATAPPNILFIMADDLGYADVGFNGSKWYETPGLDALAKDSLVFDHSYMYPTCSPSRTALFTGRQSFRTGVYTVPVLEKGTDQENIFSRWTVGREHPIYCEPLAEHGYQAIHLGKWHIVGPYPQQELQSTFPLKKKLTQPKPGDFSWVANHKTPEVVQYYPEGRGFVTNVGGTFRGDPAFEEGGYKSEAGGYWAPFSNPFIQPKPGDEWLTDRLTDDAIEFMQQHKDGPFFVNLHFYAVHRPIRMRSEESYQKYLTKAGDAATGQGLGKARDAMARYATVVESMDANVKRLVEFLNTSGLRENTIIVFTSDNGYHPMYSENKQMRGAKGDIYEGGIRVPTLISCPGTVKTGRTETPISGLDLFPTFLDLAGIDSYEGTLDGDSLVPLFSDDAPISGERLSGERPLFWHLASQYKHGTCSVIRKGDYKLIQFLADGSLELYNLRDDPAEAKNLAEQQADVAQTLLSMLVRWRTENHVPLPPNSVLLN